MKKLIVLFALFALTGCGAMRTTAKVIQVALPTVDSPAIRKTTGTGVVISGKGVGFSGSNFVITNNTPYYGEVIAYGRVLGQEKDKVITPTVLSPWGSIYDTRHFEPLYPQIPIMILFFRDLELKEYVGAAGRIIQFYSGYTASVSWAVHTFDIRSPEQKIETETQAVPPQTINTEKVSFPREWWNATSGSQFVNNVPETVAHIRVNGQERALLTTGGLYFLSAQLIGNGFGANNLTVQVVFFSTADNTPVGVVEYVVYVPTNGIAANQYIISSWDVRRY